MKMRRIAAAALILSLAAGGYAAGKTIGQKDKVRIFEETIAGDAKAAEGITACFGGYVRNVKGFYNKPYWENTYTYGGGQRVSFTCGEPTKVEEVRNSGQNSLNFTAYNHFDIQSISRLFLTDEGNTEEILQEPFAKNAGEYMKKLRDSIPENGSKYAKIRIGDILDYYIMDVGIYGGKGGALRFNFTSLDLGEETESEDARQWKAWQEFFKIPVLEEEYMAYQLSRRENGEIYVPADYGTPEGKDSFGFFAQACETEDAAYFLFDAHSLKGNLVDTSLIPGGFGIYRMPFETKDGSLPAENIKTICSLDPEAHYLDISASSDGEKLFVSYYYDEEIGSGETGDGRPTVFSEVVDIATGKCDEKIKAIDGCEYAIIRDDGDYQLFTDGESKLRVYHYSAGKYSLAFKIDDADFDSMGMYYLDAEAETKVLYEENRLTVLNYGNSFLWEETELDRNGFSGGEEYNRWTAADCNSVIINVFGKEGHEYCGRLYSNLQDFYDEDSYREIGNKLWEAQSLGDTFITDDKFPIAMRNSWELLDLRS